MLPPIPADKVQVFSNAELSQNPSSMWHSAELSCLISLSDWEAEEPVSSPVTSEQDEIQPPASRYFSNTESKIFLFRADINYARVRKAGGHNLSFLPQVTHCTL